MSGPNLAHSTSNLIRAADLVRRSNQDPRTRSRPSSSERRALNTKLIFTHDWHFVKESCRRGSAFSQFIIRLPIVEQEIRKLSITRKRPRHRQTLNVLGRRIR